MNGHVDLFMTFQLHADIVSEASLIDVKYFQEVTSFIYLFIYFFFNEIKLFYNYNYNYNILLLQSKELKESISH